MTQRHFSRAASLTLLTIGIISGIIPSLQATLLPQLVKEGRLTLAGLGQAAMAEAIGTLLAVSIANAVLKPRRLKLYVLASAMIGLALDLATARLTGHTILAARFGHGLCAGILLWIWVGFLTRSANPGRWVAVYVVAQAATLLLLSSWFSTSLLPQGGAIAGFAMVAGLYGLIALLTTLTPSHFEPIAPGRESILPSRDGWIGLFAIFALMAAILATWVYVKPYGKQIGLDEATTGHAVSAAMGVQIAAGLLGILLAGRMRNATMILFVAAASIASLALLLTAQSASAFIAGTAAFAFFWMLGSPFYMPYLIDIDPSRRSAPHLTTSQLLGVAAGPAIASIAVDGETVTGALIVAAGLYVAGALVMASTIFQAKRSIRPHVDR
ncbi:hypothetical protein [Tardiphaga sp. 367_B4_N1_1]|uniref:hypothetical protein n=1 Tax=Tardiphaga sp. 367_B4_N1_1 TaxID=3240777 RepID=UPI003F24DFF1